LAELPPPPAVPPAPPVAAAPAPAPAAPRASLFERELYGAPPAPTAPLAPTTAPTSESDDSVKLDRDIAGFLDGLDDLVAPARPIEETLRAPATEGDFWRKGLAPLQDFSDVMSLPDVPNAAE
jgi:hypothetical protein